MPYQVFITGVTGYIGGDLLHLLSKRHPTWQISCLVRDSAKASNLVSQYPNVRVVHGTLDAVELIEEEAANANLIYNCANCDHQQSANAIAKGLTRNRSKPAYWIHTSGAGTLTHKNFALNNFESAVAAEKIYDDWDNVSELTSLPDKALHRHVDKIVLATSAGREDQIRTAIVCPPAIYGTGRGPGNTKSVQINVAVQVALKNGGAIQLGDGNNVWHGVHVQDLSELFVMLGEAAAGRDSTATWNATGFYLVENGPFKWGEIMQLIADEGYKRGYLATNGVQSVSFDQSQKHHKLIPYLCGTTSQGVGKRARFLLGWTPKQKSLRDELPQIIEDEAQSNGVRPRSKGML